MSRFLLGAALLVGAAVALVGPGRIWTTIRGLQTQVGDNWENGLSDDALEAQVKVKLKDLDTQVRGYQARVGEVADRLAAAETRTSELKRQLDAEKQLLARVKNLLDQCQPVYEISSRVYTRQEITEEGKMRLSRCQRLEQQLESQQKLTGDLKRSLEQGRATLAEAQRVKQDLVAELETLKVKLTNARARKDLAELTEGVSTNPLGPDSELAQKLDLLRKRLREAETHIPQPQTGGVVDWNHGGNADEVGQSIGRYLRQTPPGSTSKR
jgi:chromosome segregation ATPase